MLKTIVLHETLLNLKSHRFLLIQGLFAMLFFGGLVVNIDRYKSSEMEYREAASVVDRFTTAVPPNPLRVFAEGAEKSSAVEVVTDVLMYDFSVKPWGESNVSLRLSVFEAMDVNFIVKVILSLIAVLITFASVSGERFDGTLKLASASGASRKHLILGKLIASFLCLAVPFVICTIISCLILALNDMLSTPADIARVCLFTLFSLIYIFFFLLVGLFISISTKRPQESLITGVLCWLTLVFIIPALVPQASKLFVDLPSARAMEQARLHRFYEKSFEGQSNPMSVRDMLTEIHTENDAVWEANRNQLSNYAKVTRWLAVLSPSDAYNNASMEIVGNGVQNALHAKKSIIQHKNNVYQNRRNPPRFEFNRMGLVSDSGPALASIFILCIEATILLLFAYRGFMRLDLREG